ncbi:LysM domain-containing protein [Lachnotalea glycerini]|uniref:LysM domain-containing protein n=1 Tax=Lachnotalea glycerini TaxID=1763509 RepID=A0A255I4Y2_9FIRM|nr:LysM peptidoglycan-binding domain-containing protein [Lachnotalea glycerini]PXV95550.1 LysM domain-containing protein [Lachnotalea glycerini]RDY32866.1 LysM peptidoglycan-binding domain-containing protein [Lachnotalea glycerini]
MNRTVKQLNSQQFYIITITVCLILAILITYGSFISIAKNRVESELIYNKYYTSIQIQKGDTLWELADNYITSEYNSYNDYIDEVKNINSLESDKIHEGQYLTVPYYSSKRLD